MYRLVALFTVGVLLVALLWQAQAPAPAAPRPGQRVTIRLWDGNAPGATGSQEADVPTLTIYPADGRGVLSPALVIAPGGGYSTVESAGIEGDLAADWLNSLGITAFVLRYRVAPYRYPAPLLDGRRAMRLVRARASEYAIDPNRIGMMGFSAGGHLASATATILENDPSASDPIDRASSRPDFLILNYPVISFLPSIAGPDNLNAYDQSGKNLLGARPAPSLVLEMSTETRVSTRTPPTFLYAGSADRLVPAENAISFYLAARRAGVPAEIHVFERAGHELDTADPSQGAWRPLLVNWLRGLGVIGDTGQPGSVIPPTGRTN